MPPERPPGPLSSAPPFCNTLLVPFLFFSLEILSQISSPLHLPCVVFFFLLSFSLFFPCFFLFIFFSTFPPPNTRMFLRRVYQITRGDKRAKVRFLEGLDNWGAIKEMKRMTENQRLLSDGGTPSGEAGLGPFGRGRLYFSLGAFGFLPTFFSQVLKSGLWGRPWHRCSFWWGTE